MENYQSKLNSFIFVAALLFITEVRSQTTINFCTAVEKEYCYFNNIQFISPLDSSQALIFMFVRNKEGFGTVNHIFRIFKIDIDGNELLVDAVEQQVEPGWDWAWKSYLFPTPAKYNIKLYNHRNELITSKKFELILPSKE
jgi:hypothetical protein